MLFGYIWRTNNLFTMREIMLIIHFLGMILAIGPMAIIVFSRMATSKMEKEQSAGFMHGLFRLNTVAHIGVTLSLVSGGYLMTPYWNMLGSMPFLIAKLSLYLVLLFTLSMISVASRKARENQPGSSILKTMNWARASFVIGLTIVVFAAVVFK